jgi:subtilisin family serine protease
MVRCFASLLIFFISQVALAQLRIAVVDTGLDLNDPRFKQVLCKDGHADFSGEGIKDLYGHGTHVAGLIKEYAGNSDYCMIIIKYFKNKDESYLLRALLHAAWLRVDLVNISGGGTTYDEIEHRFFQTTQHIKFIVAAGNSNKDIGKTLFYPASYGYKNITVVGALDADGTKADYSNYGKYVTHWEIGTNITSTCPNNSYCIMSGTSMSCAIVSGKIIKEMQNANNRSDF